MKRNCCSGGWSISPIPDYYYAVAVVPRIAAAASCSCDSMIPPAEERCPVLRRRHSRGSSSPRDSRG